MNIKKIVILLVVVLSLVLLLGSIGSNMKSQEPKCQWKPEAGRQDIEKYAIVRASDPDKLQIEVNKRLNQSWEPMGGISIVDSNCCQVMVK